MEGKRPWLKHYGSVPESLEYPDTGLYERLLQSIEGSPEAIAYDFLGYRATYRVMGNQIDRMADSLSSIGFDRNDRILVSMPTCPQGIICFYAVNKLGGGAAMIHPLSPPEDIKLYLQMSKSRFALTLDAFYPKLAEAKEQTSLETVIVASITDYLPPIKSVLFKMTKGRKIKPVPKLEYLHHWNELMHRNTPKMKGPKIESGELAAILFSGGTTGSPKGVMLSNHNLICEGMEVSAWGGLDSKDSVLAILPIFHGFGLGVCINAFFMAGARSILVPRFSADIVAKLVKKSKPSFLIGVPTLFDALTKSRLFKKADLRCLKGVFSGGDSLPRSVKENFDEMVKSKKGTAVLREGYGLTESVTAVMAMPLNEYREGSVGIPFPDMDAKVVPLESTTEVEPGENGEICLNGPAVMMGYLDQPEETARVLKKHGDGKTWLHTGDVGFMDEDGFFYFKQRAKRMIKSSGMNVYPSEVEKVLYRHPAVKEACVIGVPDVSQVEVVKAFVVLNENSDDNEETSRRIIDFCREHMIKWSCPREIEFRETLPKTSIGKIAFQVLHEEEIQRLKDKGAYTGESTSGNNKR